MITLSREEYAVFQSALMRAWQCALRNVPMTDGNAEHIAQTLLQGAYEAFAAGVRGETPLADAALAKLQHEQTAEWVMGLKHVHPAHPTIQ